MKRFLFNLIRAYIKHTPPHPGRGILSHLAWRIDPHEFIDNVAPGIKIKVRLNCPEELMCWTRGYEDSRDVEVFLSLLKEGMTVMDVGANVGMYSLLAARVVGPTGKVYAFEPVPDTFARLQEHITMNGLTHVVPISIALSDSNGTVKISVARNGRSSLFLHTTSDFIEVPMETLDSFIASHGIEEVHAIKVDVEGSEMHVVRGMRQLLSRSDKPLLMFEINPSTLAAAGTTAEELFNAIVSYGYAGHVIRKGQIIPVESIVNPTRQGKGFYFDDYLFKPSS